MAFDIYLDDKLKVVVGRDDECEVLIEDSEASRHHCRIELTPAGFALTDLDSSNGTSVNGRPVQRHPMRDGDVITIGECRITFHDPDEAARLAAAAASGLVPGRPIPVDPDDRAGDDGEGDGASGIAGDDPTGEAADRKGSARRRAAGSGRNRAAGNANTRKRRR